MLAGLKREYVDRQVEELDHARNEGRDVLDIVMYDAMTVKKLNAGE